MKRVLIIANKYASYVKNVTTHPTNLHRNKNIDPQFRYYLKLDFKINNQKNDNLAILMVNPSGADIQYDDDTVRKLAKAFHTCYKSIQIFNVDPTFKTNPRELNPMDAKTMHNNFTEFNNEYNKNDEILIATGDLLKFDDDVNEKLIKSYAKILSNIKSSKIKILDYTKTIFGTHPLSRGKKYVKVSCSSMKSDIKNNISIL